MVNKENAILVTGATGFVGSHVIEALLKDGYTNIVATVFEPDVRAYFYKSGFDKKVTALPVDIRDFALVKKIIAEHNIKNILHLAAQPIVGRALKEPYETFLSNAVGTMNILEACRLNGEVERIIVTSSDKAYGESDQLPYTEEHPLHGLAPYEMSKSCTDLVAQSYYFTYKLPVCVVRFGNIYGPGDLNFNRIIPGAIEAVIKNAPFEIRSDGKQIREYVYVKDIAGAYLTLLNQWEKAVGESFNFSSGLKLSVLDVVKAVEQAAGSKLDLTILGEGKQEISAQYLSCAKAERILSWRPSYQLEQGLKESLEWYTKLLQS